MEDIIPCSPQDQEVFQRVWQRVMAGRDQSSSPIQPGIPGGWEGDVSCDKLKTLVCRGETPAPAPEAPPMEGSGVGEAPAPEPPLDNGPEAEGLPLPAGRSWSGDMPSLWGEEDESQAGSDRAARLRRHVMDALEGWQFYRHLARRARNADARTLNSLAGELHKHARKLSAAYFLLTGLRYWPTEVLGAPAIPSYWGALRSRHQAEQRLETAFRLAADDWEDPDMLEMYGELADACQQRCRRLRSLLERGG